MVSTQRVHFLSQCPEVPKKGLIGRQEGTGDPNLHILRRNPSLRYAVLVTTDNPSSSVSGLVKLHDLALVSAPKKVLAIDSCKHHGYVVERGQLRSYPVKVKAVEDWPVPSTSKQLQRLLGFANF